MANLDPSERLEVYAARIKELEAGEISGREFVGSLVKQCGFSDIEAKRQWQDLKDQNLLAIYTQAAPRCLVEFPIYNALHEVIDWRNGMITSVYMNGSGAIVQTSPMQFSIRVPFTLFELRLAK